MGFLESYKHLEKIYNEIYGNTNQSGVSAYIDEMQKTPCGRYFVDNWNKDLERLKYYRRIRNQISHEPGYTEENLCTHADEIWLDNFYSRIMTVSDPLAIYTAKANRTSQFSVSSAAKNTYGNHVHISSHTPNKPNIPNANAHRHPKKNNTQLLLMCVVLAVILFIFCTQSCSDMQTLGILQPPKHYGLYHIHKLSALTAAVFQNM